ncbi:hypothetical protein ACKKBG_A14515 [Auxenochlorella protothecoides x Auxenochlorella symbiontica]
MRSRACHLLLLGCAGILWQVARCADDTENSPEPTRKTGPGLGTAQLLAQEGPTPVDENWVISNATVGSILKQRATPRREVLFTTIRLPATKYTAELEMVMNFCHFVQEAGALSHLMILTTDNMTWTRLHDRGLPVYLDKAFPERPEYAYGGGKAHDSPNRVFDVQKHWWGWKILEQDYLAAYMDADAIPLQDPFLPFQNTTYDVQGLSDWDEVTPQDPAASLSGGCKLYYWIEDPAAPTGTILREYWNFPDPVVKTHAHNPCQSTGVWYLRPTPPARAFMLAMTQRLSAPATRHQWDQTAWNEVILPFLWGNGEVEPLAYRLLPHAHYANVGVVDKRRAAGLPVDLVVLHSGYLHGKEKKEAYERMGFWSPSNATRSKGTRLTHGQEGGGGAKGGAADLPRAADPLGLAAASTVNNGPRPDLAHGAAALGLLTVLGVVVTLAFTRRRRSAALRSSLLPTKTGYGAATPSNLGSPSRSNHINRSPHAAAY